MQPLPHREYSIASVPSEQRLDLLQRSLIALRARDTVAERRLPAAMAQEMAQHAGILEREEEHFLVIARQQSYAAFTLPGTRSGDYAGAIGAAVDKIAEENDCGLGGSAFPVIALDGFDQRFEQVEPAMNVAYRVIAGARRDRW